MPEEVIDISEEDRRFLSETANATSQAVGDTNSAIVEHRPKEFILLIHGIRTFAWWQPMVTRVLEEIPNVEVVAPSYGFLNVFSFWCPFFTRTQPVQEVLTELQKVQDQARKFKGARISVIAHSYGTYVITQIVKDNPNVRLHRLILCGSIVSRRFRWHDVRNRIGTKVINDYGTTDIWPVLAKCLSWGYGDTGRHKFGKFEVHDRAHDFRHSDFFKKGEKGKGEDFVRRFWKPWFKKGRFQKSKWDEDAPPSPVWLSLLSILPIQWMICVVLTLVTLLIGYRFATSGLRRENELLREHNQLLIKHFPELAKLYGRSHSLPDPQTTIPEFSQNPWRAESTAVRRCQALVVGLDHVAPTQYGGWDGQLTGAANDARTYIKIARDRGFTTVMLLNEAATSSAVMKYILWAARDLRAGDTFLLAFAGMGGRVLDDDGEEDDSLDETWCLYDAQLRDDELMRLLRFFADGVRVVIVADTAHAGSVARVQSNGGETGDESEYTFRHMPSEYVQGAYLANKSYYDEVKKQILGDVLVPQRVLASVLLISSCQDDQLAAESDGHGIFTYWLDRMLNERKPASYQLLLEEIRPNLPNGQVPNLFSLETADFDSAEPFACR